MTMKTYLWHSNSSKETATWLAEKLGMAHGNLPPAGFNGTVVCWGASFTDKFKWDSRNFQGLLNDPRKVKKFTDRKVMFAKLAETGLNVPACIPLTNEATYSNICHLLGSTEAEGFTASKMSGAKARNVTTQADLQTALNDGCVRAIDVLFSSNNRIRMFVVDGAYQGAVSMQSNLTAPAFAGQAAQMMCAKDSTLDLAMTTATLSLAITQGMVKPDKGFWGPHSVLNAATRNVAVTATKQLGLDFAAVDVALDGTTLHVINVLTSPNLRNVPSVQEAVRTSLAAWVNANTMTAKEILQALVNDATDDEADAILTELRARKRALTEEAEGTTAAA